MNVASAQTNTATEPASTDALTIAAIEVTPIVVPLVQEYRGNHYAMRNRATVLTRVVTKEGVVGEAYAGDEDSTFADIVGVIRNEIAPELIGENAFLFRALLGSRLPCDLQPVARPAHRPRRPCQRRSRHSGCRSARPSAALFGSFGAVIATRSP